METTTETNNSAFNEAVFKMKRLHELQEICNKSRASPIHRDDQNNSGLLNWYNALSSLFQEVSSKLKQEELDKVKPMIKELRSKVRIMNRRLPKNTLQADKIKWYRSQEGQDAMDEVLDNLEDIEELLRKYLDEHGFATLNVETIEGDGYS